MVGIENISMKQIESEEQALDEYFRGVSKRQNSSTKMNDQSSRSHLIFSVVIEYTDPVTGVYTQGKISMIDLAGSENTKRSNPYSNHDPRYRQQL
jgi:hypothetical protein